MSGTLTETAQETRPQLGRLKNSWRFFIALVVLVLAIYLVTTWIAWVHQNAPPRWSVLQPGVGEVNSIATGNAADGSEIVLAGGYFHADDKGGDLRVQCLDASDGHLRWEHREAERMPDIMSKLVVAVDPAGDALAGWKSSLPEQEASPTTLTKLAGADGRVLWEWKAGAHSVEAVVPDAKGAVWVIGFRVITDATSTLRRFLALIDTRTGLARWEKDLNVAKGADDPEAFVQPLKNGDALVVAPTPPGGGQRWVFQRLSAEKGDSRWSEDITDFPTDGDLIFDWVVDEDDNLLEVYWNGKRSEIESTAFDLTTGATRWHATLTDPRLTSESWVNRVSLDRSKHIVLWTSHSGLVTRINWLKWQYDPDLGWQPSATEAQEEQALRVTLSNVDGSIRQIASVAGPDDRLNDILFPPGSSEARLLILLHIKPGPDSGPWRAARLDSDAGISVLNSFQRNPGGGKASVQFPSNAALTPSGRLVIAGNPDEKTRQWLIQLW